MSSYSVAKSSILVILAFICAGTSPARAQDVAGTLTFASSMRAADPPVEMRSPGKGGTRRKNSVDNERYSALKNAIGEGNDARRNGKYQVAVDAYERAAGLDPKDARAHYGLGNVYVDLACPDSAIAEYRSALNLKKDYRDAISALGYALANKQRYEEAELQFRELLKTANNDPTGKIGLAFVSWKRKNFDEAIRQLDTVSNDSSLKNLDRAGAKMILGDIFREREKWEQARASYNDAIKLNAGNERANWISIQSNLGLAQSELFPAIAAFTHLTADERTIADRERVTKSAQKAEEYVRRAVYELQYDHPFGYLYWAFALEYQFRFPDAELKFDKYLEKVSELEKQLPSLSKTKTCDYGFDTLRANYYRFIGYLHQQERFLTTDRQKIADLDNKSIAAFKEAARLKADDAGAYSTLAGIYFLQEKYSEAIEQYENALSRETDETKKADYYFGRGYSYAKGGRLDEAINDINRAIKLRPDYVNYYWVLSSIYESQGNWDRSISNARQAMEHEKSPAAHSYNFLAGTYFRAARNTGNQAYTEEAIKLANTAVQMSSTYASAYLLLGTIYKFYKGGSMLQESLKNYELAATYDPKNEQIRYGLGDLYLLLKNENAAIDSFRKAIELKPEFAQAYWALALTYQRKGDDAEAAKQFENSIKQDRKYMQAYLDLADLYDTQKNYDEAVRWLLRATDEFPTDYLPYKELARVYTHGKKSNEAIRYYEKAIVLVGQGESWFGEIMKCRILRLQGNYSQSISCVQSVKLPPSGDPNQIPYEIGLTHVASGNKAAAMKQYEELKQKQSNLAENLLKQINEMK